MANWAEIRRLHRSEGVPIKAIVRATGISRNAVRRALASDGPPQYSRAPRGSAVEDQVRALLRSCPTMPATVIAERISWDRSISLLKNRVRELRPLLADRPGLRFLRICKLFRSRITMKLLSIY